MTDLERFNATMNYGHPDRAPFREFMWPTWPETAARWAREGGYIERQTDFGCDRWVVESTWFFPSPPFERRIVEDQTRIRPPGASRERTQSEFDICRHR